MCPCGQRHRGNRAPWLPLSRSPPRRPFVALVDGAKHQIDVIKSKARRRQMSVTIVVDVIHVLEYLDYHKALANG